MSKAKKSAGFYCSSCGYESAKWMGQCPACHEWNTFTEAPEPDRATSAAVAYGVVSAHSAPVPLAKIETGRDTERISTGIDELDRVLGGGIVPGSLTLIGGDPGIGKSTLLLQTSGLLAGGGRNVLYISGEESLAQLKMRADRVCKDAGSLRFLCETDVQAIASIVTGGGYDVVIIDSIQTMYSADVSSGPGSVSQVKEAAGVFLRLAKSTDTAIFIVGHVTKEGAVAGPKMLEHMVDTVLYFEGDRYASYRILRGVKNRFGSTNEIGVFEMVETGLSQVANPSEFMLSARPTGASGSVATCSLEGTRPIMAEIQALVCPTSFGGNPRRQATGTDYNRMNLLMAVLEKRLGMQLGSCDAYVNVAGGMRIEEPALDLGIAIALASSFKNRPVDEHIVVFGEIGLSGELRAVSQAMQRVSEAKRLGFEICILPRDNAAKLRGTATADGIKLLGAANVADAIEVL